MDEVMSCFHLLVHQCDFGEPNVSPAEFIGVLDQFPHVFVEPTSLPPYRDVQHPLHLLLDSKPINVMPYIYPHFQKAKIERLVKEMMA